MNISLFNKTYTARRFGEQRIVKGYVATAHEDFKVSLNVHPPGADTISALPEGERKTKRLEAHGTDIMRASNQDAGVKGDLLYYHGNWYECVSAVEWDHTLLNHWNYSFVIVPQDAHGTLDLEAPNDSEETTEEAQEETEEAGEGGAEDEGD